MPRDTQVVLVIYGPPLVGKTTLAATLSRHLSWPHLNTDDIARGVISHGAAEHDTAFAAARQAILHLLERQLRNGMSAIVDAALIDNEAWKALMDSSHEAAAIWMPVELNAP